LPDYIPYGFYSWDSLKDKVYKTTPNAKEELKELSG
jgi:hypothetical protein